MNLHIYRKEKLYTLSAYTVNNIGGIKNGKIEIKQNDKYIRLCPIMYSYSCTGLYTTTEWSHVASNIVWTLINFLTSPYKMESRHFLLPYWPYVIRKEFCEDICHLHCTINMFYNNTSILYILTKKMTIQFNVFCYFMKNKICCNTYCSFVITMQDNNLHMFNQQVKQIYYLG